MLLSQTVDARGGAGAGAEAGGGAEGGRGGGGGAEPKEVSRSQRRTRLKGTQTCKRRGCCDAGRECQLERGRVKRNDWRCLAETKYSRENY